MLLSTSAVILPALPASDSPRRKRFTRREVERMLEFGIVDGQRCELIKGELIDKTGQNPPHAQATRKLQMQLPVEVSGADSDWSPCSGCRCTMIRRPCRSSTQYLTTKRDLYARASVAEYPRRRSPGPLP